jgi:hypothetical protein
MTTARTAAHGTCRRTKAKMWRIAHPNQTEAAVSKSDKSGPIRELNDVLRGTFSGAKVVMTDGVAALPERELTELLERVRRFHEFTEDNDPLASTISAAWNLPGRTHFLRSTTMLRTWKAPPKTLPILRRRPECSPSCAPMNTDLRKEVFFLIRASCSERPALCAIGLYLASLARAVFAVSSPFGVTIPFA